jgi:peptidoglycan/xylan/chitin deacetylase (PgdA/CDA1 family)
MRLYRPFVLAEKIFPKAVFRINSADKVLCLTFDDGPDPDSTGRILGILEIRGIKAMFFMTGNNASKYPDLKNKIIAAGHVAGNHGYMHLNGWMTSNREYNENVLKGAEFTSDLFFRPPYGHLSICQYRKLAGKFKIVFWDVMPYDFDRRIPEKECLKILKKKIRPGSVIVLHDSPSSSLFGFLDEFISFVLDAGYKFVTIS